MKRKDKIYNYIKDISQNITLNGIEGFDTLTISDNIGIDRANVSRDLNALVREGKVIKISGRPVLYVDKEVAEKINKRKELKNNKGTVDNKKDAFCSMVGWKGSLSKIVQLAKAAVMYPPNGLHVLLTGPTGSGKTMFAEMMYRYALDNKVIDEHGDFIIFNCAEYANNPQLLLSQLFGHGKGAFTGATNDKIGVVEKAQGGILLLDEIHRLPPEGQEMLFTLIDKNIYRRLGEVENIQSRILIIGATTEDIDSCILKSFLRRITMVINMPSLIDRPIEERYYLIKTFLKEESERMDTPLLVKKDVIAALLLYKSYGNIGQLKSDIRLICAKGFLNYKTNQKPVIDIDLDILPESITIDYVEEKGNNKQDISFLQNDNHVFYPKGENTTYFLNDDVGLDNIYETIKQNVEYYNRRGYTDKQINDKLTLEVNNYFEKLKNRFNIEANNSNEEQLFKLISPKIYYSTQKALDRASELLDRGYKRKLFIGLAMHLSVVFEQLEENRYNPKFNDQKIELIYKREYQAALKFKESIDSNLNMKLPQTEIPFITTVFHDQLRDGENVENKVGVLVMAHGKNTASSMADVANKLLYTNHCKHIDMPLDEKIESILDKAINKVREIDEGKGVILLVDMGSLFAFGELIMKQTQIDIRVIEMVSTPIVLECVRKSMLPKVTLEGLYNELQNVIPYKGRLIIEDIKNQLNRDNKKLILTTCITGKGTAIKIKKLIEMAIPDIYDNEIDIIPVETNETINIDRERVLVVVGITDLGYKDKFYIPTDDLILGNGIMRLKNIVKGKSINDNIEKNKIYKFNFNSLYRILEKNLIFLDPFKAYQQIILFYDRLLKINIIKGDFDKIKISMIFHMCYMIERLLTKEKITINNANEIIKQNYSIYLIIKKEIQQIEEVFGVIVPETEVAAIIELINKQHL